MRVLVGCESSGVTREAFRRHGHEAYSCDLLPADDGSPFHIQDDVLVVMKSDWDLAIFHPDCTYLTVSAEWCYKDDTGKKMKPGTLFGAERREAREEALEFVRKLDDAPIEKIAIENPPGVIGTRIRPADQWIQPYEFGHDASKKTGLWLKNLRPIVKDPKNFVEPRWVCCGEVLDIELVARYGCPNCLGENRPLPRWANQTNAGQNRLGPSDDRWKERARTYDGVGEAWATQWGGSEVEVDPVQRRLDL